MDLSRSSRDHTYNELVSIARGLVTAGGSDGLRDAERSMSGSIFPASGKRGRGMPSARSSVIVFIEFLANYIAPFLVFTTLLYLLNAVYEASNATFNASNISVEASNASYNASNVTL